MKQFIVLLLFILPLLVKGTNYTSVVAGGNWSNSATWSPAGHPGSGDNVTIAVGVYLDVNASVNNITINSSEYVDNNTSSSLTVYGNFTDNGAFYGFSGTLTFSGSSNQTISFTPFTGADIYNLTINQSASTETVFLISAIPVNNNLTITKGVLACQTYQITGNSTGSGLLSMASGTTMVIGLSSSATSVSFPTGYYYSNSTASLNSNSTVVYLANTSSQPISDVVYYGNLEIYSGASSVTKNVSASGTLTTTGNLIVGDGVSSGIVTLGMGSNTINFTGTSATSTINTNGVITFSSGNFGVDNLLITGNGSLSLSGSGYIVVAGNFTNNGSSPSTSFVAGNSTFMFNGSSNQTLGGTQTTTFYNILMDEASSTDTVRLADSVTVTNMLELQSGRFDISKTGNYSLLIKYDFDAFGGSALFVPEKGTVYFGNGGSNPTTSGSYTSTFYNVVCNPGAGNSVNTSGMNMPINNNLLVSSGNFIVNTMTVTVNNNVTISSGATLTYTTGTLNVGGNYTDNGTFTYGTGTVNFDGTGNIIQTIGGTATQPLNFYNLTVAATSPDTVRLGDSIKVIATLTLNSGTSGVLDVSKNDYEIICTAGYFTNNENTSAFDARKGWVIFNGGWYINGTFPTIFNDLKLESHQVLVNTNETVLDTLECLAGGYVYMLSPQILTIGNTFLNYTSGGFSANTGMFQFAGNALTKNYIGGTQAISLQNFKLNLAHATDTLFLYNEGLTVSSHDTIQQGVLNCQTYTLTGSSGTVLDMGGTGTLVLGLKGNGTNSPLPAYSSYNLNPSSTVIYQAANSSQSISSVPTYGNLIISSGSTITKTPSGTPLTIAGNLTVNSSTTLNESTNTINLTGSATINGTLSFSSGAFNIGGNLTNNGTFTYGTSTTSLTGTSGQTIGGSTTTTFYKLIGNSTGSETVTLGYPISVLNNLTVSSGTFTLAQAAHRLTISGNFTNSGGIFSAINGAVLLNGSAPTLGGSSTIGMDTLIISTSGLGVTLGGNIITSSNFIINPSAIFSASSYTLTTAGNFTDNGTFNCNTGTVYFDNNGYQCISGHSTESFRNLTVSMFSKLGATPGTTVNISGTVTVLAGGQMNCYCGP
jgi:hypothetical protein